MRTPSKTLNLDLTMQHTERMKTTAKKSLVNHQGSTNSYITGIENGFGDIDSKSNRIDFELNYEGHSLINNFRTDKTMEEMVQACSEGSSGRPAAGSFDAHTPIKTAYDKTLEIKITEENGQKNESELENNKIYFENQIISDQMQTQRMKYKQLNVAIQESMKSEIYESQTSNMSPSRNLSFLLSPKIKEGGIVIKQTRKTPNNLISVVATHSPEY